MPSSSAGEIMNRKGFPESFDTARLLNFLASVKSGVKHVEAPVYSHFHYDILPDQTVVIENPDILIVEGLNVLQPARMPRDGEAIPLRVGFLRLLHLPRRRARGDRRVVRCAFHAPAHHGIPRSRRLFPPVRQPGARRRRRTGARRSGAASISGISRRTSSRRASARASSCARPPTTTSSRSSSASSDVFRARRPARRGGVAGRRRDPNKKRTALGRRPVK